MRNEDDFPKIGRDFQKWSELDPSLPKVDIEINLFRRNNVSIAALVIVSGLLKGDQQLRQRLLSILTPDHFNPRSLPQYLYQKIAVYPHMGETIPVSELEKWIPEYHLEVWGESHPEERMFYADNWTLRQILNFDPTEEQINRAIELREMVIEHNRKYGY